MKNEYNTLLAKLFNARFASVSHPHAACLIEQKTIRCDVVAEEYLRTFPKGTVINQELYDNDSAFGGCLISLNPHFEYPTWDGRQLAEYLRIFGKNPLPETNVVQFSTTQPNKDGAKLGFITLQQIRQSSAGSDCCEWVLKDGTKLWLHTHRVIKVEFVSVWEEGEVVTSAKANLESGSVFDIEITDAGDHFESLEGEFIQTRIGNRIPVEPTPDGEYGMVKPWDIDELVGAI